MFLVFVLAEGSPPVPSQPLAVQVEFVALALMLAGVAAGWWRDGLAACLTLGGWTLFHLAERHVPPWSLFHVAAIVGVLFAVSWAGRQVVRRRLAVVAGLLSFPFPFGITIDVIGHRLARAASVRVSGPATDAAAAPARLTGHGAEPGRSQIGPSPSAR